MSGVLNDCDALLQGAAVRVISDNLAAQVQEALDAIATISDDNVLSKGEKAAVIQQWNTIVAEYGPLKTQADSLAVSRTTFDARYTDLYNHLVSLNPAPAWHDVLVDTPIVGTTFRTRFTDYYVAKEALRSALASKAASAPNLNVGIARNLLSNSAPGSLAGWGKGYSSVPVNGPVFITPGHIHDIYSPNKTSVMVNVGGAVAANNTCDLATGPLFRILPGRRYEFSAAISTHRSICFTRFVFYDANRAQLNYYDGNPLNNNAATSAANPFPRSLGFVTAPANAAFAVLLCTMVTTGENDPHMFVSQAYVGEALPAQTVGTSWAEGAPADVRAIGYLGDMNASWGAPAGTHVAGVDAATVVSTANSALSAANNAVKPPEFSLTGTFGGQVTNSSTAYQTLSKALNVSVSGNANPVSITWSAVNMDSNAVIRMAANTGTSTSVSVSGQNISVSIGITCTVTDSVTGVSLSRSGVVILNMGAI